MPPSNPNETEEIQRGAEAEFLLGHPLIKGALEAIEHKYMGQWLKTKEDEVEKREAAHRMLRASLEFQAELKHHVQTGTLAAAERAERETQKRLTNGGV